MATNEFKRIVRPATAEERQRHAEIRAKLEVEFPPVRTASKNDPPSGLPAQIRTAREAKGLTWYAIAKLAGIPNPNTVRDIENGRDAQLSNVEAVAKALGLRLELVEEKALKTYALKPPTESTESGSTPAQLPADPKRNR
jgi:transcriptional regulator with XRE-family HTH domain